MDNWIDINDQLPDDGEILLIWTVYNGFEQIDIGYLDRGTWIIGVEICRARVTHWMPQPSPPSKLIL
jgi:hypothetical protein